MTRSHIVALLALVAVVPAMAVGTNTLLSPADETPPCFASGSTGFALTGRANADFIVKVDNDATNPDLVLQLVDDPARADFVLADGAETAGACVGTRAVRTIRVDTQAREPDLTVALRPHDAAAPYRIYANSPVFSAQDAAALFAVMVQSKHKSAGLRNLAVRNDDITGSLTPRGGARQ
jgi:hypothetical protein